MGHTIEAIIFDCFGVLAVDGWLPFKQRYFGADPELLEGVGELNRQTDAGLLPYDAFVAAIAKKAGIAPAEFRQAIEQTVVNEELLDYIATELKPKYKIGMLSNVAGRWLEQKFSAEHRQLFDGTVLSSQTGYIKPDPRAYQAILDQLAVEPAAAVFVDDREGNCGGARDVGMQAICYQSLAQFKRDLTEVLAGH